MPTCATPPTFEKPTSEGCTVVNRLARWLAVLVLLATTSGCMDTHLHCEVPSGGDVNVLGRQNNG
jgi:hypothetical protein